MRLHRPGGLRAIFDDRPTATGFVKPTRFDGNAPPLRSDYLRWREGILTMEEALVMLPTDVMISGIDFDTRRGRGRHIVVVETPWQRQELLSAMRMHPRFRTEGFWIWQRITLDGVPVTVQVQPRPQRTAFSVPLERIP